MQGDLRHKAKLNVQRLKEGLCDYNAENGTTHSVADTRVQGSVAMATVVQSKDDDYGIDVVVVFDKTVLGEKDLQATRDMVSDVLGKKGCFNVEPGIKKSCVRIRYAEGYRVDLAAYHRKCDCLCDCWNYAHADTVWGARDLHGFTDWFIQQNANSDGGLRCLVRLSKMFCKSRELWKNMPNGLTQTVLRYESLQKQCRHIDNLFYYSMKSVVDRIECNTSVVDPIGRGVDLVSRDIDKRRLGDWKKWLKSKLEDLEVLFRDACTRERALQAWVGFFDHGYWDRQNGRDGVALRRRMSAVGSANDTEKYVGDLWSVILIYSCEAAYCVEGKGWRPERLFEMLSVLRSILSCNFRIRCDLDSTNCLEPHGVFWEMKSVGTEAERMNQTRGQIRARERSRAERSLSFGDHYIGCYLVQGDVCAVKTRVDVPIGRG